MFRRTPSEKLAKRIKLLLVEKKTGQEAPVKRIGTTPGGIGAEDMFVKSVIDSRLTASENAVLVHRLLEVREAFIAMLLSNREISHDRDYLAG